MYWFDFKEFIYCFKGNRFCFGDKEEDEDDWEDYEWGEEEVDVVFYFEEYLRGEVVD